MINVKLGKKRASPDKKGSAGMKFTTKEDIEAPIEHVFKEVSDFSSFERSALRRGADINRVDSHATAQVGSAWDVAFKYRGKERRLRATLTGIEAPNGFTASIASKNLEGSTQVDLVALSRSRTRLTVSVDMTPKTLAAKLLVKSLSLAKGNINKRFALRVADFAEDVEERFTKTA